jgi:hypothetical protein
MDTDLQRIDVKLLLDTPANPNLDPFLTIFDRWRNVEDHPCDWVDLADYAHMIRGPGILIAGKRDRYSINLNDPGPGLMTSTQGGLSGDLQNRFSEAIERALQLNETLTSEPEFPAEFKVRKGNWEIFVNDRLGFPNDDATDLLVRPAVAGAFAVDQSELLRHTDPLGRLGYSLRS